MKPLIDPINTDDGQFHGRDNQTGALATIVTPVYMNDTQGATRSLQREVISVLTAAGIKPADATNDQLLSALKSLFLAEDDSRVSGALQKDKNLSDVADAPAALKAIGGVPTTRKINSHALDADINLTPSDVEAFPAKGGTVGSKGVTTPYLFANGHGAPLNQQGTWIEWNETNGQGESAFINNKGSGSGGFNFRVVNSDNTKQSGEVSINGKGELYENSQRVFSPNNPPPYPVTSVNGATGAATTASGNLGAGWWKDNATGLIIQTGAASNGSPNTETHNFNIAFPNACMAIVGTLGTGITLGSVVYLEPANNSQFTAKTTGAAIGYRWIALGY